MFFQQFGLLFTNMQWYVAVCIALGLVFLFIEIFMPGFGAFGISGFGCVVLSIILRAVFKAPEDNALMQVFQMLLLYLIVIGGGFVLFFVAHKKNWLKKSPFVQEDTAVDINFSDGTENFTSLVGKEGAALTALHPSGKADIEGKTFDVVAENFYVSAGEKITVNSVEGSNIRVAVKNKEE